VNTAGTIFILDADSEKSHPRAVDLRFLKSNPGESLVRIFRVDIDTKKKNEQFSNKSSPSVQKAQPAPTPYIDIELVNGFYDIEKSLHSKEQFLATFSSETGTLQYYESDIDDLSEYALKQLVANCKKTQQLPFAAYIRANIPSIPRDHKKVSGFKEKILEVSLSSQATGSRRGIDMDKADEYFQAIDRFIAKLITVSSNISVALTIRTIPHGAKGGFWDADTKTLIQPFISDQTIQHLYRGNYVFKIVSIKNESFELGLNLVDNDFVAISCEGSMEKFTCEIR
jgi:hypothetical protein